MANTTDTVAPEEILRGIIDGTIPELEDDLVTTISDYRMFQKPQVSRIDLQNVTSIKSYAFNNCPKLEELYLPELKTMPGGYTGVIGSSPIHYLAFPKITSTVDSGFLSQSHNMYGLDFGTSGTAKIPGGNGTLGGNRLYMLILRSNTIVPAESSLSTNIFKGGSPFCNGGIKGGGTVYIPKVLYDHLNDGTSLDYYSATNWSAAKTWSYFHFAQIEGSRFEFYNVDGTLVDESVTPDSISATLDNNPGLRFYEDMDVAFLKEHLTVTATFGQTTVDLFKEWYDLEGTLSEGVNVITVTHRGKTTSFTVNVSDNPLPEDYTPVGYVYGYNAQYVNTGIAENNARFYAEYGFRETSRIGGNSCGHILSSTNVRYPKIYNQNSWATSYGTATESTISYPNWDLHSVYHVTADYEDTGEITVNGETIGNASLSGTTLSANNKLYLMTLGSSTGTANAFAGKVFYMRLYQNDVLAHDYVPCINPSNVPGFYDTVAGAFLGSSSSTAFTNPLPMLWA